MRGAKQHPQQPNDATALRAPRHHVLLLLPPCVTFAAAAALCAPPTHEHRRGTGLLLHLRSSAPMSARRLPGCNRLQLLQHSRPPCCRNRYTLRGAQPCRHAVPVSVICLEHSPQPSTISSCHTDTHWHTMASRYAGSCCVSIMTTRLVLLPLVLVLLPRSLLWHMVSTRNSVTSMAQRCWHTTEILLRWRRPSVVQQSCRRSWPQHRCSSQCALSLWRSV